jgi:alkyl sulfatase BDS1-like metallo-beta-lactamase superfamily hydrolase
VSQALALEGKVSIPKVVAPTVDQIKALEPGTFVNYHRVRIDPIKAQDTDAMIRFEFTDAGNKPAALHVRRGVVEYIDDPDRYFRKPDFTIALTRETWAKLYLSEATVRQLAASGEAKVTGDVAACDRVLDLFDKLDPVKNTLVPHIPPLAMHAP